ncbi:chitobiase/beta-hexosaminidase C-terminal domain-containing protein [Paenibacillus contaminans]|uniref:Uncharacterized protein n=1 Tax=Paenibacillus contaminans TaxID=450362 RepID=A0A329MQ80_9BACL|nr:chitobiase/beta-hexosaminidase C-terminal domain-containing protein [Paenibacillus contaminans]RAV22131.1 hypothetical protein DQG23_08850 [Paenibacillus contaminans]
MIGLYSNRNSRQLFFYKIMSVMLIVCVLTAGFGLRSAEAYGGWRSGGISGEGPGFPGEESFPPGEPAEENGDGFVSVSAGPAHVLAVRADGSLWAWGSNISGELGIGTADPEAHPKPIRIGLTPEGQRFKQAAAGGYIDEAGIPRGFSIVLDESGHVWVWGDNGSGQLGLGDTESRYSPALNDDLNNISDVYAGGKFAAALSEAWDGYVFYDLYTWGNNDQGQLGRSSVEHDPTSPWPVSLNRLDPIVEAALGDAHMLLIQESDRRKTLKGWGNNAHKQLSRAENAPLTVETPAELTVPGDVEGGELLHVAAGGTHSVIAIGRYGENEQYSEEVWTIGANEQGQLGNGTNEAGTEFHMSYSTDRRIGDLAAGYDFTMLVNGQDDRGLPDSVYGWGDSSSGQLGFSQAAPVSGSDFAGSSPLMTMPLNGIAAGLHFALGIEENGELYAWGTNTYGQLGIGISGEETVAPERVHFPTSVTGASIEEWGEIREFGAPASYRLQFTAKSGIAPGDKITLQIPQAFMPNPEVMPFEPSDIEIQMGGGTPYTPSEVFAGTARTLEIPLSQEAEPGTTVIVNLKNDKLIVPLVEDSYSFLLYTSADAYPVYVKSAIGKIIRFSATASNYLANSQAQYHFELITRFDVDAGQSLHFYMPAYTLSENGLLVFYNGQRLSEENVIIDSLVSEMYVEFSIVVPDRIPAGQKVTFDIVRGLGNPSGEEQEPAFIQLSIPALGDVERVIPIGVEPPFRFNAGQEGTLATGSLDVAVNAEGFEISDYSPYKVRFSADGLTWPDQGWQDLQPILSYRLGTGEEGLRTIFVQLAEKEDVMRTFTPFAVSIYCSEKTQLTGLSISKSGEEYIPTVEPFEPERSAYTVNLSDSQSGELLIEPFLKDGARISPVVENAQLVNDKISVDLAALPIGLTPVVMTIKATDPQYGEVENKIIVNVNISLPLTDAQLDFRSGEDMPAFYKEGAKLQVKLTAPNVLFANDRIRVEVPASFLVTRTTEWNATAYVRQSPGIEDSTPVEVIVKPDSVNREFIVELTGAESVLVPADSELTLLLDKEPDTPGGAGYPVVLPDSIGEYEASVSTTRNLPFSVNIVVPADSPQDVSVTPGTDMASAVNVEYAIAFISPNTLDPVNDPITISFPEGYVLPETMGLGSVSVNSTVPTKISINEEERKISIFTDVSIRVGDPVSVVFDETAGLQNPSAPGNYSIDVSTELTLNSTSVDVTIVGKAAAPTASLENGAIVASGTTVTLNSETAGAKLHYTWDGSTPTSESPWVGSGENVTLTGEPNQAITLKVIALKEGMTSSEVSTFTYTIQEQAAAPTASLENGAIVAPGTTVTLSSETVGAKLHYTWDGSTPTSESPWVGSGENVTLNGAPNQMLTLKVIALKEGMTASEVSTFTYTIQNQAVAPTASHVNGTIVAPGTTVTLSSETVGAKLHYTWDGSIPTSESPWIGSGESVTLTGEPNAVITLKVIALKEGMTASEVSTFTFTIQDQAAAPTASLEDGATAAPGTTVTLNSETAGAKLHYTWDGSIPTSESPWVGSGESVTLTGEPNAVITLKVIALKEGMTASEVSTFTYTIQNQAAAPTASLVNGTIVAPGTTVTLSSETVGAKLHYTWDGSIPTSESPWVGSGESVILTGEPNQEITLKVIALKAGMQNSEVAVFQYTIRQALSDNNYLSGLGLLGFDETGNETQISIPIRRDLNDYQVTVGHHVQQLLIMPKLEDLDKANLQMSVNNEQASVTENVYLDVGVTNIAIVVTAENNETRSYTLNVTRSGPSNADLIGISIHGALSAPSGNEISLKVDAAQPSLEWLVQTSDPLATYAISQISGPTVTGIVYSPSSELVQVSGILAGEYRFRIVVTAQDLTEKTYEVTLSAEPEPLIGKFAFVDVTENTITLMLSAAMNDDVQLDPQKFAIERDGQTFTAVTAELDSGDLSGYSLRLTFETPLTGNELTLKLADGAVQLEPGKRNIAQMLPIKGEADVAAIRAEMDTDGDGVRIDDVVKYLNRMHDVTGDGKVDRNDIRFLLMQIGK